MKSFAALLDEIAACRVCAAHLAAGPRPVVQLGRTARIVVIGQAPGARVHDSGVPWQDASGERLREWTGIDAATFYDAKRVALMPMGFCYPGKGASGDLPPRPECAPLWHDRIVGQLPQRKLTLLVGSYAQARYLPGQRGKSLTDMVRDYRRFLPAFFPLPHPSWRSTIWMRQNPWFERRLLPELQKAVRLALDH